ncbi:unnamed protein product [Urochloa humidicola]
MAEKISTIVLKVDLECEKCYKKIRRVLCKIQGTGRGVQLRRHGRAAGLHRQPWARSPENLQVSGNRAPQRCRRGGAMSEKGEESVREPPRPPPACNPTVSPATSAAQGSEPAGGEADGHVPGGGEKPSPSSERTHDKTCGDKGRAAFAQDSGRDGAGDGTRPSSYRDAVVKPRTFKPRFPASSSQAQQQWFSAESMGARRTASTVWSRLGPGGGSHDGAGGRLPGSNGGGWLETLKAKAGRRCYNCLSSGHFIAVCRDPPRCLRCFRFGHKAARCDSLPHSAPRIATAASRASHLAASGAAPTTAAALRAASTTAAAAPHPAFPAAGAFVKPPASAAAVARQGTAMAANLEAEFLLYSRVREERPSHVAAGVRRTDAIREDERALESFGLIAVQADAGVRLETARVRQEAARQLHVPIFELGARRLSAASFLLRFDSEQQRNRAYRHGKLNVGPVRLQILPWMRQVGACAELFKFFYHVRVCIEGVPEHARHPEAVAGLFPRPSFIDDLDCDMEKAEEEECYRLWIWTTDPAAIATTATLHVEEPVTLPQEGYAEGLVDLGMPMGALRFEPALAMDYEVIIHIDRVLDYTPPSAESSRRSRDSPVSGIPVEELEESWPARHPFPWTLGVPDGVSRRETVQRRVSVHDRLGDRSRDRSPPRGGGSSGMGLRQVPPSGFHDIGSMMGRRGDSYHHGSSSRNEGGHYRRRGMHSVEVLRTTPWTGFDSKLKSRQAWRPKQYQEDGNDRRMVQNLSGGSFLIRESSACAHRGTDPMVEEATRTWTKPCQSAWSQASVEPPAAEAGRLVGLEGGRVPGVYADTCGPEGAVMEGEIGEPERGEQTSQARDIGEHMIASLLDDFVQKALEAEQNANGAEVHVSKSLMGDIVQPVPPQLAKVTGPLGGCHVGERATEFQFESSVSAVLFQKEVGSCAQSVGLTNPGHADLHSGPGKEAADLSVGLQIASGDGPAAEEFSGLQLGQQSIMGLSGLGLADVEEGPMMGVEVGIDGALPNLSMAHSGVFVDDSNVPGNRMLDLNMDCADHADLPPLPPPRTVLGGAEARLNRDGKEHSGPKSHVKGIARLAVPLRKSLFCQPPPKARQGAGKKHSTVVVSKQLDKKTTKGSAAGTGGLGVEDRATALLLQTAGIISAEGQITAEAEEKFGEKFVEHMESGFVADMRVAFGLPEKGASGSLDSLALIAEEEE